MLLLQAERLGDAVRLAPQAIRKLVRAHDQRAKLDERLARLRRRALRAGNDFRYLGEPCVARGARFVE